MDEFVSVFAKVHREFGRALGSRNEYGQILLEKQHPNGHAFGRRIRRPAAAVLGPPHEGRQIELRSRLVGLDVKRPAGSSSG